MTAPTRVAALDIGGTKLAAGVVETTGEVLRRAQVPTPVDDPWPALEELLVPLVEGCTAIGVGCGGPMEWPAGVVSPVNITGWRGFPLKHRLEERFGLPVRIHNDAVCFALGESWLGAGGPTMLGMVVSTGVGGGIVVDGRALDGASGNAGHVGHVVVEPDGPPCGCGARGCLEAVARGPAVVARAAARGCPATDGRALVAAAAAGDPVAVEEIARAGRALGVGIASAAALLDVALVVVGGGFARAGEHLWRPLREELATRARLSYLSGLRVVPAALGGDAGLVGAARLVLAEASR